MISDKMKELMAGSSVIRAMFTEGKRLAEIYGAENVYNFSLGNPSIVPPATLKQAIRDILDEESEMELHGYMDNSGYTDVRESIADFTNKSYGTNFTQRNIIMTVGAAGGLNVALKSLVNPGEEVIVIAPYFGEYNNYISNVDGIRVVISPDYERFSINFDELESKITPKTKFLIINSPNNPTGSVYTAEDLKRLADILNKKQAEFGTSIYLFSDEPYREIAFDGMEIPYVPNFYKNTIVGYSYSKSLSIPGERIGYLVINNGLDDFDNAIDAMSVATRILGFVNAPSLMQKVVARCLGQTSDVSIYEENRNILYDALTEYGYECVKPGGTFYMFPKCPIDDDVAFCEKAKEFRLVIVPGSGFNCPGYFRIAFCVDKQTVLNSLDSFKKLIDCYK